MKCRFMDKRVREISRFFVAPPRMFSLSVWRVSRTLLSRNTSGSVVSVFMLLTLQHMSHFEAHICTSSCQYALQLWEDSKSFEDADSLLSPLLYPWKVFFIRVCSLLFVLRPLRTIEAMDKCFVRLLLLPLQWVLSALSIQLIVCRETRHELGL